MGSCASADWSDRMIKIERDPSVDAVYIHFSNKPLYR